MPAVISPNSHEGMCRLEMKLHGYVLIYAISFHQRWLLWHLMPSKHGDKTDWFRLSQIEAWYTAPLSLWGVDASLRACESDLQFQDPREDNWRMERKKKHTQGLIECSAVTCKTDHEGEVYTKNSTGTCYRVGTKCDLSHGARTESRTAPMLANLSKLCVHNALWLSFLGHFTDFSTCAGVTLWLSRMCGCKWSDLTVASPWQHKETTKQVSQQTNSFIAQFFLHDSTTSN